MFFFQIHTPCMESWQFTLPETNIFAPENGWLEYWFPCGMANFQGRTVSFREGNRCGSDI